MRTNNLSQLLFLFLCAINLTSCQKEEWDFDTKETEQSTVVEGKIITSGGLPLANIEVKVDYNEDKWLAYTKIKHKATTTTDKNGKYRLFFSIKDDELETEKDKEIGISKVYSVIFDIKQLNSKEYIMPSDMSSTIISIDPPIAESAKIVETIISGYGLSFEREKTYTQNLYIPQKRLISITLKGFIPRQGDYFELSNAFPYGREVGVNNLFPNTNYGYGTMGDYLFALYDTEERTYQVPCALNENNLITLIRKKDGVFSTEEFRLFISKDTPEKLIFEY